MVLDGFGISRRWIFWFALLSTPLLLVACTEKPRATDGIEIQWQRSEASGLFIPKRYLDGIPNDSVQTLVQIRLAKRGSQPAIFGSFVWRSDGIFFEPLIPLTRGLSYEITVRNQSLDTIEIPLPENDEPPLLTSIYPSQDTIPQNLLKMYLQFSAPMQEGRPLSYVAILNAGKDTVASVFLDLQPALWNREGTLLTLWLDPGRIKRDLQPNQRMGEPLQLAMHFQLVIRGEWKDVRGVMLGRNYYKDLYVAARDSISPVPESWSIRVPEAGTQNPLVLTFGESLDAILLQEAIHILDDQGERLTGTVKLSSEEAVYSFTPDTHWKGGRYRIRCESRLEDLAGNNLNRLFDRDVREGKADLAREAFELPFEID